MTHWILMYAIGGLVSWLVSVVVSIVFLRKTCGMPWTNIKEYLFRISWAMELAKLAVWMLAWPIQFPLSVGSLVFTVIIPYWKKES